MVRFDLNRPTSGRLCLAAFRRSKTFFNCRATSDPFVVILRIIPFNSISSVGLFGFSLHNKNTSVKKSFCSAADEIDNVRGAKFCIGKKTKQIFGRSKTELFHTGTQHLYSICGICKQTYLLQRRPSSGITPIWLQQSRLSEQ